MREKGLEAELFHTCNENLGVFAITFEAAFDAAGSKELFNSGIKRDDHMGWGGEAPLRILFHGHPLVIKIKAQCVGIARTFLKDGLAD